MMDHTASRLVLSSYARWRPNVAHPRDREDDAPQVPAAETDNVVFYIPVNGRDAPPEPPVIDGVKLRGGVSRPRN
jgi:hypothetical protein